MIVSRRTGAIYKGPSEEKDGQKITSPSELRISRGMSLLVADL